MSLLSCNTSDTTFCAPKKVKRSTTRRLSLRRTTSLTIVLLVVIAFATAYEIFNVVRQGSVHEQIVVRSAWGMLVLLAIVILMLGKYVMQRSLSHIESQLRTLKDEESIDPFDIYESDDLKPVMKALSDYVDHVRTRLDRLRLQKKELDIQMRFSDAERRNIEAIVHGISDVVLVIDSFGELIMANAAAEKLFNFHLDQIRHRPIERVLEDGSLASLIKDARTNNQQSIGKHVEYATVREGKSQTYDITLSTFIDADGQSRGVVAVFHNITREREIAQVKADFVSSVSHELRTPLSSIKAYVEMLTDNEAHDERQKREFYKIIQLETDRLQRMIGNILDISRIESGIVVVDREWMAPNEMIKDVLGMISPQADEKDISLQCELGESLPEIRADRDMLYRTVLNLVSNAIKYTQQSGCITVRTNVDEDTDRYVITVTDNGMGISADDLPHIFDRFYRSKDCGADAKGTGLGLSLVKQIVEKVHHGQVSVASERGKGTTVKLYFPIERSIHGVVRYGKADDSGCGR
ncbi:MAG: PAS domain-containing protein [Planctomycetota bacterium]|nr:MAG: PAS domain-containing protein [Planctomycetota bacterium]